MIALTVYQFFLEARNTGVISREDLESVTKFTLFVILNSLLVYDSGVRRLMTKVEIFIEDRNTMSANILSLSAREDLNALRSFVSELEKLDRDLEVHMKIFNRKFPSAEFCVSVKLELWIVADQTLALQT